MDIRTTFESWKTPPDGRVISGESRPHGMRTISTRHSGWDTVKVVGDVHPIDIPSLERAAMGAFLRRPVRLVIDLTDVGFCCVDGIRWLLRTQARSVTCGGELRVEVVEDGPLVGLKGILANRGRIERA